MPQTESRAPRLRIPHVAVGDIQLPPEFGRLYELAYNLWWSWSPRAQQLFAMIDGPAWAMYRNPVQVLINVSPSRWPPLRDDETFTAAYSSVLAEFDAHHHGNGGDWFARTHPDRATGLVAYLSMEYGLHACLPGYAGGLGVLSGDHLKGASELGLPLIALGLLYRHGYFHQTVDADGLQQHTYLEFDFTRLPVRPVAGPAGGPLEVRVPFPGRDVSAGVWFAQVGRVPLLLLTTDVPANDPADRTITNILYVRSREGRLAQELVLGVGGARALRALGIEPAVWHMNEGHSALVQVERLREAMAADASFDAAVARVRARSVFTTHTPVPAGHEQFDADLARRHIAAIAGDEAAAGMLRLGDADHGTGAPLNLTALGIRTAAWANAVSRLNAQVCDEMWRHLRPELPPGTPAIHPITNGVHTATWCGRAVRDLHERHLGMRWAERLLEPAAWGAVRDVPDEELWAAHATQKQRLIHFIRSRLREQFARHGAAPDELRALEQWFDPAVLTIAFARRFATYKRVWLVFSDRERLRALFTNAERPVQLVFAGKAHPADRAGQDLIRQTVVMAREDGFRGRVCFLEDYDMRVADMLVQGADVWLNTPRRPMEASGTSGQKAAVNGGLNVSVLDGWWPEAHDGSSGWAIEPDGAAETEEQRDALDAAALYRVLEQDVVPTFYDRDSAGLPRRWIAMMKHAMATITPGFSAHRMVRDYVDQAYLPLLPGPSSPSTTP
jgi:starch phosphorylase